MRGAVAFIVAVICRMAASGASPAVAPGYADEDSLISRLSAAALHPIEGIWQFAGSGATVAIERMSGEGRLPGAREYRMVALRSEDPAVRPGAVMGYLEASGDSREYDARLFTDSRGGGVLSKPRHFTVRLAEEGCRFELRPVKSKYSLNLWRLLPYMFRYSVRETRSRGEAAAGCVRIFPEPEIPAEPVYL